MFIKEFEKVEIILTKSLVRVLSKKLNEELKVGQQALIHWSLLRSTTMRTLFIKVKCDECKIIFERRIRDLNINKTIHYCKKCACACDRNVHFGKPASEASKIATKKFIEENGNPFTWESSKEKIKEKKPWLKAHEKNLGSKRTEDQKNRMSQAAINAFKNGTRIPNKRWGKTVIKQYKGIDYQSKYELRFLEFIESIGLLDYIERGPIIEYHDSLGKIHNYFSDFKIKDSNYVFEIKSKYTWEKNLDINLIKKSEAEKLYEYYVVLDNKFNTVKKILLEYGKKI